MSTVEVQTTIAGICHNTIKCAWCALCCSEKEAIIWCQNLAQGREPWHRIHVRQLTRDAAC